MTFQTAALNLINTERAQHNLPPLMASMALDRVAQDGNFNGCGAAVVRGRCQDMGDRNYFSHSIKDCANKSFTHMLNAAGIVHSGAGENVAFVSEVSDEAVAASNIHGQLMADGGHAGNILSATFTHVGIGVWRTETGKSWTGMNTPLRRVFITSQIFARNPVPSNRQIAITGCAYNVLNPARLLDTRTAAGGALGPGATRDLQITGAAGVPSSGVSAVVLTVAVAAPTASGFLTVFPAGEPLPTAANLNFTPGLTVANTVVAKVGAGGKVSLFNHAGSTHVVVDVAGWFDGAGAVSGPLFHPVVPGRILDTRSASAVGPGATLDLPVLNRSGVPATGVSAVVINFTAVTPSASGFITVFPTGTAMPPTSSLNLVAGAIVPNLVVTGVGTGGAISVFNSAGITHLIADVAGWFDQGGTATGARYHPLTPARILDTRTGIGAAGPGKLGPGAILSLQVAGAGGVPGIGAAAVVLNVTVAGPSAQSFLTVFPAGDTQPNTANLNFVAGQIVPNLVVAKLGAGGRLSIFNQAGSTDVIADIAGWFDGG